MIHTRKHAAALALALICFTGIASIAWKNRPVAVHAGQLVTDTVPGKEKKEQAEKEEQEEKIILDGDIDKAIEDVNRAQKNLNLQLQKKNMEQLQNQLNQSMRQLNDKKIQEDVNKAMKQLDVQKLKMEVEAAQQQINWKKMEEDLQNAQKNIAFEDIDKLKENIKGEVAIAMKKSEKAMREMKALNMEKMQKEMIHAQEAMKKGQLSMKIAIEKAQQESRIHFNKDLKLQLEKAQQEVQKASAVLQAYKEMLGEMEKDGLLKTDEPYKIEYKKGELYINDTKQPANVTEKYKHYFKGDNIILQKNQGYENGKKVIEV